MSAAEMAGRVAGPTYLSGSWLGTDGAAALGAGVPSSADCDADEHAPIAASVAQLIADEIGLTSLRISGRKRAGVGDWSLPRHFLHRQDHFRYSWTVHDLSSFLAYARNDSLVLSATA